VTRRLHPRRGPHDPATETPARRPGSVRRTTTHDSLRPDGLLGDVRLTARGRDLQTGLDGTATVLGTATVEATIRFVPDRLVVAITVDPTADLAGLVGVRASSGFRQALDEALPGEEATHSLRYQLLDDVPTATLVSGYALGAGGVHPPRGMLDFSRNADLCAGWARGATLLAELEEDGHVPVVTGPEAPTLDRADDPLAWHGVAPLDPHGMRRRRRIDVWQDDGEFAVECFFRDTHLDADGLETVIHEYTVHGAVDAATMRFTACDAEVGALPWMECPGAAASAGRLIGTPTGDLRSRVRETFVGTSTCTHLNDTLRSLADLSALVAAVRGANQK
jgi:hypothetical protein